MEDNDKDKSKEANRSIIMCCSDEEHMTLAKKLHGKVHDKVLMRLNKNLEGRGNVVMTRLNDDDLKQIDALVEVEIFKSRSEAAAYFIKEGIQARKDLFDKVMPTVDKIRDLKDQAKKSLNKP